MRIIKSKNELVKLYKKLFSKDILNSKNSQRKVTDIGLLIDCSFSLKEIDGIKRAIELGDKLLGKIKSKKEKAKLFYYMGNAYSDSNNLLHIGKKTGWLWQRNELDKMIIYYRTAISNEYKPCLDNTIKCQIYTNLGNSFSHIGRYIEAQRHWNKALDIDPDFGMAIANKGKGFYEASRILYDETHQGIFLKHAYRLIVNSFAKDYSKQQKNYFVQYVQYIEKMLNNDYLNSHFVFKEYSFGRSKKEKKYRKWCLRNKLFLNVLNDVGYYSAFAHDVLSTPSIIVEDKDPSPKIQGFFNQIKQEYIVARYLYFTGTEYSDEDKFVNKRSHLIDTLDYPEYGISVEKIRIAFRLAYSVFDKIAFLINEYFNIQMKPTAVSFKRVWGEVDKNKNFKLRKLFRDKPNWALRGLFWLSKDLFELDEGYKKAIEPTAEELANIRNSLEHKYLKLHWMYREGNKGDLHYDTLAYSITKTEFEEKTLNLLSLVREAIIYTSLAIHIEEIQNKKDRENYDNDKIKLNVPLFLPEYKFYNL